MSSSMVPGVGGDEVQDQVPCLVGFFGVFLEHLFEFVVDANAGFHHFRERPVLGVFGGALFKARFNKADLLSPYTRIITPYKTDS